MSEKLLSRAATITDLKKIAKSRIPGFAFEYIMSGCNNDCAVTNNRLKLDQINLNPRNLNRAAQVDLTTTLFGQSYASPFGIAPIGLSGVAWPRASEFHAQAAHQHNIPLILSSVSTTSIETAASYAKGNLWFQLYPPKDLRIRADMLDRAHRAGCRNLVVTIDVPSLSWRPRDIKNGLAIPPRISFKSIYQTMTHPLWAIATAKKGMPKFETLEPYIEKNLSLKQTAQNIRHALREVVDENVLKHIRDNWQGNLIVKGILSVDDALSAVDCGADGLIISNHGGRQLDAAVSPVQVLTDIKEQVGDQLIVMADSGVESGVDIARYLACGAQMVFAGRAFMYGVSALGQQGAAHTITILNSELTQILEQLRCSRPAELPNFRI